MSNNPLFDGEGVEFHHLQRVGQQRQTAEIQRLLQEQARHRRGVCPCPHCGGGIPQVGVSVCMHCRRELYWHDGACAATSEKARQLAQHAAYVRGAEERRKKQYESEVAANKAARAAYNTTPEGKKKLAKQAAEKRKRRVQTLLCVAGAGLVWTGLAYVDSGSSLSLGGYFIGPGVVLIVAAILLARIKVG